MWNAAVIIAGPRQFQVPGAIFGLLLALFLSGPVSSALAGDTEFVEASAAEEPAAVPLPERTPTFAPGEQLTYSIRWNRITVGEFTVQVQAMATLYDRPAWHFMFNAATNGVGDKVYKVRNTIHSYVSTDLYRSYRYVARQQHAGKSKWVMLDYDWDTNKVRYRRNGEDRGWRPAKPDTVDPLALFYAVRATDLSDKKEIIIRVGDGRRTQDSRAVIVGRETVTLSNGKTYDTYLVEPELTGLSGIFEKSDDSSLQIWITTDKLQIPVRISSKVVVGRFFADLIRYQPPPKEEDTAIDGAGAKAE